MANDEHRCFCCGTNVKSNHVPRSRECEANWTKRKALVDAIKSARRS